ncbi:hypothetical protein GF312_07440, partial [Candidatus Poribacteria bacterium]|nr:hypothetical protein [Candidatus Poribacteria bacterium]
MGFLANFKAHLIVYSLYCIPLSRQRDTVHSTDRVVCERSFIFMLKIFRNIITLTSFIITFLSVNIVFVWNAICQPIPSPAGGNYLVLDGMEDYAFLDFDRFDVLLEKGTKEFTVEVWIYPTSVPKDKVSVVLSQQVVIQLANYNNPDYQNVKKNMKDNGIGWRENDFLLIMYAYKHLADAPNNFFSTGYWPMTMSPNEWHHIVFQAQDGQVIYICDNSLHIVPQGITIQHDLSKLEHKELRDFVLGGYQHVIVSQQPAYTLGSFNGFIDEVRISDIPRYDVKGELIPQGKFDSDAHTIALWHFDELHGAKVFRDSSDY